MFQKKCRAFKLDPTAEFFKQAGILYSGTSNINEYDDSENDGNDNGYDDGNDDGHDDGNNDDNDDDSDDDSAPGYTFLKLIMHLKSLTIKKTHNT